MPNETRRRRPVVNDEPEEIPRRRRRPMDEEPVRRSRPEPEDSDVEDAPEDDEDEDIEEAPRASRRSARRGNAVGPRASRGPSGRAGRRPVTTSRRVARGWGGYNKVKAASSDFETKFKPSNEGSVVALLEEEPFAAFARHWVDLQDGKRAFICPASLEADGDEEEELACPLCDVGDRPNSPRAYLNVAILRPGERPEHAVWEIGASISEQLQMIDKSIGRRNSLTDIYIHASSKGSGLNTKYHLEPLYPEDLDDFEVNELTEKQRNGFELYDEELYEIPSYNELDKIADEIA